MPSRRLSDRHPFEIYLLLWTAVTSVPPAFGATPVPTSIAGALEGPAARAWAIVLCIGACLALVGLAWKRPPWPDVSVTGLLLEQIGLLLLAFGSLFYVYAIFHVTGLSGLVGAGIILAFGLACGTQAFKIWSTLRNLKPREEPS